MEKHLLITNSQNKYNIEQLGKKTQELRENTEVIDSRELKDIFKEQDIFYLSNKKYKLSDLLLKAGNLNVCLCPSPIYENVYYDIACFDKSCKSDIVKTIQSLAGFMGAKRCEIKFVNKEEYKAKHESNLEASIDAEHPAYAKGNMNYKQTDLDNSSNTKELQKNEIRASKKGYSKKITKEELQEYINKKYINIDNLPDSFLSALESYLETEKLSGIVKSEEHEKVNQNAEEQSIKSGSIKAQIAKLPLNIGAKFDYQKTSNESSLRDCLIEYFIDFGD
ncbi:hypothetical protein [Campylobacter lari]|uniref:Uncharacterized protein n=1 Tax=Campylobacter lari NCTC 11845 TaxID=1388749 RepID=A0A0A8HVY5_CAMLA|nr:hypothetical protein [Campylobacter lari]AJD00930.1 hypothetical protein UPTC3659_0038 [Campylobacter lari NCTC 11845]EAK9954304.1 hypothetical protein [Campylobacter lari]